MSIAPLIVFIKPLIIFTAPPTTVLRIFLNAPPTALPIAVPILVKRLTIVFQTPLKKPPTAEKIEVIRFHA
jgi:hypothetical protein